jgi:hypothetical protein
MTLSVAGDVFRIFCGFATIGFLFSIDIIVASNPPAEPPMPTMGQLKFFFKGFERDVRRAGFDCADFVRLSFFRERDALLLDVRFAAMYVFMLIAAFASYKVRFCSGSLCAEKASSEIRLKIHRNGSRKPKVLRGVSYVEMGNRDKYEPT